ncbi:hypothetical protein HGRIS_011336 [Hohenbuehelia grisea]|uniref:Cytochrome P450 n=1 Tax=Hohenbuehelia grisea TaxID=104357 RepID=A0ABR3JVL1_9AGAR
MLPTLPLPSIALALPPATTLLVCLVVTYVFRHHLVPLLTRRDVHKLPGPSSSIASWVWGHELLTAAHESLTMYTEWARSLGPVFRIRGALMHSDIIVATDHTLVQHIFADTNRYVKSPAFRPPAGNVLGRGLVWAEGAEHAKMRRLLDRAFSQDAVKQMASDIYECAEKLETKLTNHVLSHSGDEGGLTINIVDWTSPCTLDIIGRVAFGHDFRAIATATAGGASDGSDAALIRASWDKHVNMLLSPISFAIPLVIRMFPPSLVAALPFPPGVVRGVVRRLAGKLLEKEQAETTQMSEEEGDYATQISGVRKAGVGKGKDIMSIMMRARKEGKDASDGLTDDQILDNISTFTYVLHLQDLF